MSRFLPALLAAAALTACASAGERAEAGASQQSARVDREARRQIGREDALTQMAFWAAEYQTFPNDLEAAQGFAEALRKGGRTERAVQIAAEGLRRFPDDRALMTTLGYALVAEQQPGDALRPLASVAQAEPQNWRVRSALGAALDQLGRYEEARMAYQEALALAPNEPRVLTNLGVSYIMSGDAATAEPILRQAAEMAGAPPQARANLAIALALTGRFAEAEQIQRVDLPPGQAAANVNYLRGLLSGDGRRWGDLGGS